ncbi:MAG: Zn-dependent hydrolase [Pseudomonadota bacterium]
MNEASLQTGLDPALQALARRLFDELRRQTFDGVGVSRATYGAGETAGMAVVGAAARREGLRVEYDAAANLVITLDGREPDKPFVACGSHLDSVPQGGNFDGAAGVIGGLLALLRQKATGAAPPRTIKVYALRGEESAWFGKCYLGSSALFGRFDARDLTLRLRESETTLGQAMEACGADVARVATGARLVDPQDMALFLELHIEQGPVMVARGLPVAIVTGIRGNVRHPEAVCRGEAAHAGAVPRWLRRDAVFAASELVMRLDRRWESLLEAGEDLVVTCGIFGTNPAEHAMSRVPGELRYALEYRSQSEATLEAFGEILAEETASIGRRRGVVFDLGRTVRSASAVMHPGLVEHLMSLCARRGVPHERIPSGAGHDAAIFANQGIPTAMIFIRNQHGSHNPREAMEFDDFFLGVEILYDALRTGAAALS